MVIKYIPIAILGLLTIIGASDICAMQSQSSDAIFSDASSCLTRAQLEKILYARSGAELNENEYKVVISPFLDKVERELKSIQFCMQNQNCAVCHTYLSTLLLYNDVCFTLYVQNNSYRWFQLKKPILANSLNALAQQGALQQDEVATEIQKIDQLLLEANKAYYSALPWYKKFGIWLNK